MKVACIIGITLNVILFIIEENELSVFAIALFLLAYACNKVEYKRMERKKMIDKFLEP